MKQKKTELYTFRTYGQKVVQKSVQIKVSQKQESEKKIRQQVFVLRGVKNRKNKWKRLKVKSGDSRKKKISLFKFRRITVDYVELVEC